MGDWGWMFGPFSPLCIVLRAERAKLYTTIIESTLLPNFLSEVEGQAKTARRLITKLRNCAIHICFKQTNHQTAEYEKHFISNLNEL